MTMTPERLLERLSGNWWGVAKTWFEPDKLADESSVVGRFEKVFNGKFVRHTYESSIQGKKRIGEELLAFNSVSEMYESSWIDDFHMNYGIMFSFGKATDMGFEVHGKYDVPDDRSPWGWRTTYEVFDPAMIRITAYNIRPDGIEAKAIETEYRR